MLTPSPSGAEVRETPSPVQQTNSRLQFSLLHTASFIGARVYLMSRSVIPTWTTSVTVSHVHSATTGSMILKAASIVVPLAAGYLFVKGIRSAIAGANSDGKKRLEDAQARLASQSLRKGRAFVSITDVYEQKIMADLVFPEQIDITFDDIGGSEAIKEALNETLIVPLTNPHLFTRAEGKGASRLLSPPKGVLLYGPPGTGKTMMARAIAKDCDATFIEVRASTLHDKYYGESQKLVHALFSLAAKLAPTIIFIDKIDLFLGHRGGDSELETSSHIKGAFMTLWDGMLSGAMSQVTIVGATNRPHEIDPAIQRRLTRQILVGLPDADARGAILRLLLQQQTVEHGFSVDVLATQTAGYSGSDLAELCKYACMTPVREVIRQHCRKLGKKLTAADRIDLPVRPVDRADFTDALKHVRPTGAQASEFFQRAQANALLSAVIGLTP